MRNIAAHQAMSGQLGVQHTERRAERFEFVVFKDTADEIWLEASRILMEHFGTMVGIDIDIDTKALQDMGGGILGRESTVTAVRRP